MAAFWTSQLGDALGILRDAASDHRNIPGPLCAALRVVRHALQDASAWPLVDGCSSSLCPALFCLLEHPEEAVCFTALEVLHQLTSIFECSLPQGALDCIENLLPNPCDSLISALLLDILANCLACSDVTVGMARTALELASRTIHDPTPTPPTSFHLSTSPEHYAALRCLAILSSCDVARDAIMECAPLLCALAVCSDMLSAQLALSALVCLVSPATAGTAAAGGGGGGGGGGGDGGLVPEVVAVVLALAVRHSWISGSGAGAAIAQLAVDSISLRGDPEMSAISLLCDHVRPTSRQPKPATTTTTPTPTTSSSTTPMCDDRNESSESSSSSHSSSRNSTSLSETNEAKVRAHKHTHQWLRGQTCRCFSPLTTTSSSSFFSSFSSSSSAATAACARCSPRWDVSGRASSDMRRIRALCLRLASNVFRSFVRAADEVTLKDVLCVCLEDCGHHSLPPLCTVLALGFGTLTPPVQIHYLSRALHHIFKTLPSVPDMNTLLDFAVASPLSFSASSSSPSETCRFMSATAGLSMCALQLHSDDLKETFVVLMFEYLCSPHPICSHVATEVLLFVLRNSPTAVRSTILHVAFELAFSAGEHCAAARRPVLELLRRAVSLFSFSDFSQLARLLTRDSPPTVGHNLSWLLADPSLHSHVVPFVLQEGGVRNHVAQYLSCSGVPAHSVTCHVRHLTALAQTPDLLAGLSVTPQLTKFLLSLLPHAARAPCLHLVAAAIGLATALRHSLDPEQLCSVLELLADICKKPECAPPDVLLAVSRFCAAFGDVLILEHMQERVMPLVACLFHRVLDHPNLRVHTAGLLAFMRFAQFTNITSLDALIPAPQHKAVVSFLEQRSVGCIWLDEYESRADAAALRRRLLSAAAAGADTV